MPLPTPYISVIIERRPDGTYWVWAQVVGGPLDGRYIKVIEPVFRLETDMAREAAETLSRQVYASHHLRYEWDGDYRIGERKRNA
ncbi:MAG: hypothetical protein BroJett007_33650 [Chloroflexota bacterium]|nr:MAG: hypothetical protein BroJett007_33650 [Chloroflexota bacterium]